MKTTLKLSILAVASILAACGGGGGGDSATTTPTTPGATTPTTPTVVVSTLSTTIQPTTYAAGSLELANYTRLNAVRLAGGFGTVAQDASIDKAALAHTNYAVLNSGLLPDGTPTSYTKNFGIVDTATGWLGAHVETPGMPGFTGVLPQARINAAGGTAITAGGEVMNANGNATCVDGLLNTVFHRSSLLRPETQYVGFGLAVKMVYDPLMASLQPQDICTIEYGFKGAANVPGSNWISVYPGVNQANVPVGMPAGEVPDPAPEIPNATKGSPISIYFGQRLTSVNSFTLTAASSTTPVPVKLLTDKSSTHVTSDSAHILPTQNLAKGTTYTVNFNGTLTDGSVVTKTWTFTTVN